MKKSISLIVLAGLLLCSCRQKTDEEAAIKKLLEKESATWRSGDVKAHADCWHIQPYSRILVSTGDGVTIDVPPAAMITPAKMGNGGSSINSNYKMSINGNTAWVSHNEESIAKDGSKTYSYEIRLLEKISKEWKLTGQSIHIYKPE
ncbi:MAG: endo-arabinase [Chitinophagaceae bacterium]|nr:endo-arabinase [Chitinophagaceae bacterium]